jgi:hypothetical protein
MLQKSETGSQSQRNFYDQAAKTYQKAFETSLACPDGMVPVNSDGSAPGEGEGAEIYQAHEVARGAHIRVGKLFCVCPQLIANPTAPMEVQCTFIDPKPGSKPPQKSGRFWAGFETYPVVLNDRITADEWKLMETKTAELTKEFQLARGNAMAVYMPETRKLKARLGAPIGSRLNDADIAGNHGRRLVWWLRATRPEIVCGIDTDKLQSDVEALDSGISWHAEVQASTPSCDGLSLKVFANSESVYDSSATIMQSGGNDRELGESFRGYLMTENDATITLMARGSNDELLGSSADLKAGHGYGNYGVTNDLRIKVDAIVRQAVTDFKFHKF